MEFMNKTVFYKCSDDSIVATFDPASVPSTDYLWLCDSSAYLKAYTDGTLGTEETNNNPTYLEQFHTTATTCPTLTGFAASDDFNGTAPNTSSKTDKYSSVRWTHVETDGTISISGNALQHVVTASGIKSVKSTCNCEDITGDFDISFDVTVNSTRPTNNPSSHNLRFYINSSSNTSIWIGQGDSAGGSDHEYTVWSNGTQVVGYTTMSEPSSLRFARSGSTLTAYVNGSSVWSGTNSSTMDDVHIISVKANANNNTDSTIDNWVAEDGAGGALEVDPDGDSCT